MFNSLINGVISMTLNNILQVHFELHFYFFISVMEVFVEVHFMSVS